MPIDYTKSKIYKIVFDESDKVYIGATTRTLRDALNNHKGQSKYSYEPRTLYKFVKQHGWHTAHIELIEEYPCTCLKELEDRKNSYIDKFTTLNMKI